LQRLEPSLEGPARTWLRPQDQGSESLSHRSGTVSTMRVAALFAGIGGIELGLHRASESFEPSYFCEWWGPAQAVLRDRFPGVPLDGDIKEVSKLPRADIVAGGFPCTDLSQAGKTAGIDGDQSGLVLKALSLVEGHKSKWLLLENVRNMLPLHGGRAMAAITDELSRMGFRWAYRLVDSRFTGVPQRRQRVIILASRTEDPRPVLFADDVEERADASLRDDAFGFYWTEGLRGLGWCRDGVPTLKGGSTIGIASPPAVWLPNARNGERIVKPTVTVGERMQGFPAGWTRAADSGGARGEGFRWKLVGNAVTVGVSAWVGKNLLAPKAWDPTDSVALAAGDPWPTAAWGDSGRAFSVTRSLWPVRTRYQHLADVLGNSFVPLSARGTLGFVSRLERGNLHVPDQFRLDLKEHLDSLGAL